MKKLKPRELLYLLEDGNLLFLLDFDARYSSNYDWEARDRADKIAKSLEHIDIPTVRDNILTYHLGEHDYTYFGCSPYLSGIQQELMETKWSSQKVGFREEKLWAILA